MERLTRFYTAPYLTTPEPLYGIVYSQEGAFVTKRGFEGIAERFMVSAIVLIRTMESFCSRRFELIELREVHAGLDDVGVCELVADSAAARSAKREVALGWNQNEHVGAANEADYLAD